MRSKEWREKISKALKGRKISDETKRKLSQARIKVAPWNKGKRGVQESIFKGKARPQYAGDKNPNWKGGAISDKLGYVLILKPEHPNCDALGYVREHRLIMEKKIGRYLLKTEVVHHKNGKKSDNRISNLELLQSQGEHARQHKMQRV